MCCNKPKEMNVIQVVCISSVLLSILICHFVSICEKQNTSMIPAISNAIAQSKNAKMLMKICSVGAAFGAGVSCLLYCDRESALFLVAFLCWVGIVFNQRADANSEIHIKTKKNENTLHNTFVILLFCVWVVGMISKTDRWDAFRLILITACICSFPLLVTFSLFEFSCYRYDQDHHLIGVMEFAIITSLMWLLAEAEME